MTQYEMMLLELDLLERLDSVTGDTFEEVIANAIFNLKIDIENVTHERIYVTSIPSNGYND